MFLFERLPPLLSLVSFIAWLFLRGRWGRRRKILYTFLNILEKEADDRSRINRDAFRKVCLSFLEVDFLEIRICWNKSRQNQVELKIVENGVCKSFWFTGSLWQADGGTKNIVRLGRNRVSGITVPGIFQTMIYLSEEKERNLPPARSADLIFLLVIGVTYRSLTLQCLWINYPSFPSFFFFFLNFVLTRIRSISTLHLTNIRHILFMIVFQRKEASKWTVLELRHLCYSFHN